MKTNIGVNDEDRLAELIGAARSSADPGTDSGACIERCGDAGSPNPLWGVMERREGAACVPGPQPGTEGEGTCEEFHHE
jgi:hypothetical protein